MNVTPYLCMQFRYLTDGIFYYRETFWKLTYFVDADGEILNPNVEEDLSDVLVRSAMFTAITGGTGTYDQYLATTVQITTLVRLSELFFMTLVQKASPFIYVEMEQALVTALVSKSSGNQALSTSPIINAYNIKAFNKIK